VTDGKKAYIGFNTCRLAIKVKAGTTGCNITCPEMDEVLTGASSSYHTGVTAADKKGLFEGEQSNPDKEYDANGDMYLTWYVQISDDNSNTQAFNFTLTNQLNSRNDYITHFQLKINMYEGIKVGDIIYADGSWTSGEYNTSTGTWTTASYSSTWAATHGKPIAIVISTSTTAYDQALNYINGYAIALKRYNSGSAGQWCVAGLNSTQVTDDLTPVISDNAASIRSDKDGLKHCHAAYTYIDNQSTYSYSDLTAIYAAVNGYEAEVAAPSSTSGWYLPSLGQLLSCLQAAKPTVYTGTEIWTKNDMVTFSRSNESSVAAGYMNSWLSGAGLTATTHYESYAKGFYLWTSTERTTQYAFALGFHTDGTLYMDGDDSKSEGNRDQVLPVLAF